MMARPTNKQPAMFTTQVEIDLTAPALRNNYKTTADRTPREKFFGGAVHGIGKPRKTKKGAKKSA